MSFKILFKMLIMAIEIIFAILYLNLIILACSKRSITLGIRSLLVTQCKVMYFFHALLFDFLVVLPISV